MKKIALFIFMIALSVSTVFASALAIKVTVSEDTLAVGTNVSLVTGGVELVMQKAGTDGYAKFNVTDGSYFVLLRRGGYPLHASLVEVNGTTNITLTMRQLVSYASAYGQIYGPADFSSASVVAISNGEVKKRSAVNKDGFYTMSFLPEGPYQMVFQSSGFMNTTKDVFLPTADFTEVDAVLSKAAPAPEGKVELIAPAQVQQFSVIEITVTKGGAPLAGESVNVETPSGKINVVTDARGVARVNAAEGGSYTFTYGGALTATKVSLPAQPVGSDRDSHGCIPSAGYTWCESKQMCLRQWEADCPAAQNGTVAEPSPQGSGNSLALAALLLAGGAVVGIIILVAAIKFLMPHARKAMGKGKHAHEGRHGHAHHHKKEE